MNSWTLGHTIAWIVFIIALPIACTYQMEHPREMWWMLIIGFAAISLITGHGITGSWKGALVDGRNTVSLSRFQMVAWTILILSALCVAVFWNIYGVVSVPKDVTNSVNITLPGELWLLMGISTASLVGSPLILSGKKKLQPDQREMEKTFELLTQQGYDENKLSNEGQLIVNVSPDQARWSDLFTGEETGNFAHLDLARLQMFFFTLISLLVYGVAIAGMFETAAGPIKTFPELSEGLLALIGISHTGYLAAKGIANSQTGSGPSGDQPASSAQDDQPAVG